MNDVLQTSIEFLKGVGPQRAKLLRDELGIATFKDLLSHYPFRYVDRSQYNSIRDLPELDGYVQLKGKIISLHESGNGRQKRLSIKFQDETGIIDLVWFQGIKFILPSIKVNVPLQVFGKPKFYQSSWSIPHPEITLLSEVDPAIGWQPVYSSTEKLTAAGLHSKGIQKLMLTLLAQLRNVSFEDAIPVEMRTDLGLIPFKEALFAIHIPQATEQVQLARKRFKFEELLHLQIELLLRRQITLQQTKGNTITQLGEVFNSFYETKLPFPLTNAQKRVLKEIRKDLGSGIQMNRLLQGDVGSGKTVVALLTGSTKKAQRKIIHEGLLSGEIHILIGTHALLEDIVQFQNLGIVVIDEQHRFGVAQRARLWKKNTIPPHILVMTATPIPRTLAMTFYGDLEVSVIDELPPGRKPITTHHRFEKDRLQVLGFVKSEIELGRQVYIVYPLIKESEKLDYANLMDGYESIVRYFPLPDYHVSIVNGQMKPEAKDYEMQLFIEGKTQIMVATTVIEVGVNVPNASVMIIESSERFGLSQLHQLRGRVGRGADQSYCILMTGDKLAQTTKKRINTMVRTNDGFEISEVDLELRGPGDIMGTQQSGTLDLKIADLAKDGPLVALAREKARAILTEDPRLLQPAHYWLRMVALKKLKDKPNWAEIS